MSDSKCVLYKIVAHYQYSENYAAHNWDGEGICPQYWKFKGGEEDTLFVGVTLEMACDPDFMAWARDLARENEYSNDYAQKHFLDLALEHIDQLSWLEQCEIEYEGDYEYLECFPNEPDWKELEDENAPIDRYDRMAEELWLYDV